MLMDHLLELGHATFTGYGVICLDKTKTDVMLVSVVICYGKKIITYVPWFTE